MNRRRPAARRPRIPNRRKSRNPHPAGRSLSYFAWILIFLTGAGGGGWIYFKNEQSKEEQRLIRIAFLERQGSVFVENRRWQDAASAFSEIERISPGSDLAKRGRRSIEAGMMEEQTQFVGYWTGQAIAELESGRLDEATAAARQVLDKVPKGKGSRRHSRTHRRRPHQPVPRRRHRRRPRSARPAEMVTRHFHRPANPRHRPRGPGCEIHSGRRHRRA